MLKRTSAFNALLTACQPGFWSSGVGGGKSWIDIMLTWPPLPGTSGTDLSGWAGYVSKPSLYCGPAAAYVGVGPPLSGMNDGYTACAAAAPEVGTTVPGRLEAWGRLGAHAASRGSPTAPMASPLAERRKRRRLNSSLDPGTCALPEVVDIK